jgi:hypothetical protein
MTTWRLVSGMGAAAALVFLATAGPADAQVFVQEGFNPWTGQAYRSVVRGNPWTGGQIVRYRSVNPWTGATVRGGRVYNPWTGRTTAGGVVRDPWTGRYRWGVRRW